MSLFPLPEPLPAHPAKYTDALLVTMATMLRGRHRLLDPFGGTGKVFLLERWLPDIDISAIEIEPEWAARNPRITLGNALSLPYEDASFDAICTSPTYGNRMADAYADDTVRLTYKAQLGRALHPDNSGSLSWGKRYRYFHERAWLEATRVLCPGGAFILNIKDHIRGGKVQPVTEWHTECLLSLGYRLLEHIKVAVPSNRFGANSEARMPYESVLHFTKP